MTAQLITKTQMAALIENGRQSRMTQESGKTFDPRPIVKLFTPDAQRPLPVLFVLNPLLSDRL